MSGWYAGIAATLLAFLVYVAYSFKLNWIKDTRNQPQRIRGALAVPRSRKVGKVPPVYPNGWFVLLESSELKKSEVKHVSALGENFAVFRTESGVVNILEAFCPHLGANMAEGGRVRGECLECPFHSWIFRGEDGYCDSIPYAEKVPHIARTKAWKCCEVNHLIFVWYHAESIEPDWQPQPHMYISSGTWRYQGRNDYLVNCHIQDIAENAADFAHFNAVHSPAMFLTGNVPWLARHEWTVTEMWRSHCSWADEMDADAEAEAEVQIKLNSTLNHSVANGDGDHLAVAENANRRAKHKAGMQLRHSLVVLERFTLLNAHVSVEQIGPGYVELTIRTSFGPMCIVQTVTPVEPLLQRVTHQIYSPPYLAPYATLILFSECVMFERDVAVWNYKRYERQPTLVKEDRTILAYRRWYSQFYSARSPTYQTAMKDHLQW